MLKTAIIGSGISGMGSAYLLCASQDVALYEKEAAPGGHTRTLAVHYDGKTIAVDTGFIVYNERNYPNLTGLFRHLGVTTQKSNMTFGVTAFGGQVEWGAQNPNAVFGQRRNLAKPAFYRMLLDIARFNKGAVAYSRAHPDATLGRMVDALGTGEWFRKYYLIPMGAAIWSCPTSQMLDFPAETFVHFFDNHGLLTVTRQPQWYTVTGGSREYVKKLLAAFQGRVKTDCGARSIRREGGKVFVTDTNGETLAYDRLILACHADQALKLLSDASAQEQAALGSFRYQKNHAVLHRDSSFMPKRRRCWSSWVYNLEKGGSEGAALGVTYWMNLLQSIDDATPLFVTLNPTHPVRPECIFDEHDFEHPVFTREAIAAQHQVEALQGVGNTWYAGAYLRYGFHEDGLLSAVKIAQKLGVRIPWH